MKIRFWTPQTVAVLVVFLTGCSIIGNGVAETAELFVILLGMFLTYKIIAHENI